MRLCHAPQHGTQPTSCSTSIMTIQGSNFAHAAVNARVSLVLHRPYLLAEWTAYSSDDSSALT